MSGIKDFRKIEKRPTKVAKAKSKARESKMSIFKISLVNLGSFGVDKAEISLFLNLKAIKAKKAAIVA